MRGFGASEGPSGVRTSDIPGCSSTDGRTTCPLTGLESGQTYYFAVAAERDAVTVFYTDNNPDPDVTNVNGGTDTITVADHPFVEGDPVIATLQSGTLSTTNLTDGALYYIAVTDDDNFRLRTSPGGADLDIAIDTNNSYQLAIQLAQAPSSQVAVNLGTDTFTLTSHSIPDGDWVRLDSAATLPFGLYHDDKYYVVNGDANTFQLARSYTGGVIDMNATFAASTDLTDLDNDSFKIVHHNFSDGDRMIVSTSGGLPAPLDTDPSDTTYYVVESDTDNFKLSLTSGGAAIDLTTIGSGNHTFLPYLRFGTGAVDTAGEEITIADHNLVDGDAVELGTSAADLPNPFATSTTYYVVSATASTFQLASTPGGAAIDITDTGTGVHTVEPVITVERLALRERIQLDLATDVNTGTDTFTSTAHGLDNRLMGTVRSTTGHLPAGMDSSFYYFLSNVTANTFQLSYSRNGSPIDLGSVALDSVDAITDTLNAESHGFIDGRVGQFQTSGTLPDGIVAATDYYIVSAGEDSFKIATSEGGDPITIDDAGSGTHTFVPNDPGGLGAMVFEPVQADGVDRVRRGDTSWYTRPVELEVE